jgi:hypothetical protein
MWIFVRLIRDAGDAAKRVSRTSREAMLRTQEQQRAANFLSKNRPVFRHSAGIENTTAASHGKRIVQREKVIYEWVWGLGITSPNETLLMHIVVTATAGDNHPIG